MTNPTLERAARAVAKCRVDPKGVMSDGEAAPYIEQFWGNSFVKESHFRVARAVLMAVRGDMHELNLVGEEAVRNGHEADGVAIAMIDAILAPEWPVESVTADLDSFKKRYIKPAILAEGE